MPTPSFVGLAKSPVAGCPKLGWRLARHADGSINGIAYYADASGAGEAKGTRDQSGDFTLQVTSTIGKGPVGTVVGRRGPNGGLVADMKGEG